VRNITRQVDAVFENGILRPLDPLPLKEMERVRLTITNDTADPRKALVDREFLVNRSRELAGLDPVPTLDEVHETLAHDKSSWSVTDTFLRFGVRM
jgi:predicted DNA-binding antitoxin AbrB/MazE fold protein